MKSLDRKFVENLVSNKNVHPEIVDSKIQKLVYQEFISKFFHKRLKIKQIQILALYKLIKNEVIKR